MGLRGVVSLCIAAAGKSSSEQMQTTLVLYQGQWPDHDEAAAPSDQHGNFTYGGEDHRHGLCWEGTQPLKQTLPLNDVVEKPLLNQGLNGQLRVFGRIAIVR